MSKVALITGITGQDGSYLAEFLLEKGYSVYGLFRRGSTNTSERIAHLLQQKAEEKQEKQNFSTSESRESQGEVDMTHGLFDQFHALWDGFEKQLKGHIVEALAEKNSEGDDSSKTKLSSVSAIRTRAVSSGCPSSNINCSHTAACTSVRSVT